MAEQITLADEFENLCVEFDADSMRFLHYLIRGQMAEASAINEQMKASLDRQHEIRAALAEGKHAASPPKA